MFENLKTGTRPLFILLALSAVACGSDDPAALEAEEPGEVAFELLGTWESNFGESEVISEESWGSFELVEFDNDANTAVTHTAADAMFNADTYSSLVWTEPKAGSFYYCTVEFGLPSVEAARAPEKMADADDLEGKGCGGFSWTKLTRVDQ